MNNDSGIEWQRGWPIVLGAMICSGFGIPLFYYVFSLFVEPLTKEFSISRGMMANSQALIVIGALAAPFVGRTMDKWGFARVFTVSTFLVVLAHGLMGTMITSLGGFAAIALLYGAAGVGCGPLAYTRPLNAWFWHSRGLALGVSALGLAITALIAPPLLAELIAQQGWRVGFLALGAAGLFVALPLTLWLMKPTPPEGPAGPAIAVTEAIKDNSHWREPDFWLLATSMLCVAIPGAGLISTAAPLMADEGIDATTAATAISAYAIGQIVGRIFAGWFLDHANPRLVAFFFTFVPAFGFLALWGADLPVWAALAAIGMVGVQQGAEIDLFAWFTARRFGLARYGSVYGGIIAVAWLGNAGGILLFGRLHDATGDYTLAELIGAALLAIAAVLIALVQVSPLPQPHIDQSPSPAP